MNKQHLNETLSSSREEEERFQDEIPQRVFSKKNCVKQNSILPHRPTVKSDSLTAYILMKNSFS